MINKLIRPPSTLDADAVSYGVYKNQKHVQKNKNRLSFVVEQKQNYAPTLHAFSCWQRTTTATMELITLIYFLSSRFSLQCAGLGYGRIIYFFLCPFGVGKVIEWHCSRDVRDLSPGFFSSGFFLGFKHVFWQFWVLIQISNWIRTALNTDFVDSSWWSVPTRRL